MILNGVLFYFIFKSCVIYWLVKKIKRHVTLVDEYNASDNILPPPTQSRAISRPPPFSSLNPANTKLYKFFYRSPIQSLTYASPRKIKLIRVCWRKM